MFAGLAASARSAGKRPRIIDCLIAATAIVRGLPLSTQDQDFEGLPGVRVILV